MHPFGALAQLYSVGMTLTELDRIVREHQHEVYRYLRYLGADAPTAEDLVQETFLAAYAAETDVTGWEPSRRAAWLRGIARNKLVAHWRRLRSGPVLTDPQALAEYAQRAEAVWTRDFLGGGDGFDYLEALRKCLEVLPTRGREVVRMRYEQGKSREDMAVALELSDDGVKSLLRRTRAALGECVQRRLGRPAELAKEVADGVA